MSAVGARHLSIGTLAFAGTNGALKDETRPPAYRMVAYADHGVVVFDRPDDTTKQHWPRHRARARVVYCSRPPNTHLITQTSTHPPHSSDGTTSFKFPHRTGVPSTFSLHLSGSFCSDKTQHSTHSLTLLRVVATGRAHAGPRTSTVRRSDGSYCPRLLCTRHIYKQLIPEAMPGALAEGRTYTRGDGYNYSCNGCAVNHAV